MNQRNLFEVDWNKIPAPADDGCAAHLGGMTIPPVSLRAMCVPTWEWPDTPHS